MRLARTGVACAALALFFGGCGEREFFTPQDVDLLVVDAVLLVDATLPRIELTRSLAPDEPVSAETAGERGATITVTVDGGESFAYSENALDPGRYDPPATGHRVLPETSYALEIVAANGQRLTASTLTPPRLSVDDWLLLDLSATRELGRLRSFDEVGDAVYDVPENQLEWGAGLLEARFARSPAVPAYQVALFSLDPESEFAIEPDFFDEEDFADIPREGSSPMFDAVDGSVRLPWFAVFFEGRYLVKIFATDRNWNDLVRTSPTLSDNGGFGGNAGEGFDRPVFHVEGGIGLFGSAAVDSIGFRVLQDDETTPSVELPR